jgi:hypothetical protein
MPELNQGECGTNAWDIGVLGRDDLSLTRVRRSVLTDTTGAHISNVSGNPAFVGDYCNGARWGAGPMNVHPTVDEGGAAWISVRFGPLNVQGDYHIGDSSSAIDLATAGAPSHDIDGEARPNGADSDSGADEYYAAP